MTDDQSIKRYLDNANLILLVMGPDARVRLINQKGCEILGYRESQILGKNWFDHFIPERFRQPVREVFDSIVQERGEFPEFFENPVITGSGSERLIAWRNAVLRDDEGCFAEILSTGEDITVRRETENALRESEGTLRAILDTCVDGIITIDDKGEILSFNPAAVRIFGYRPGEVIGREVGTLMPDPDRGQHPGYLQRFLRTLEAHIIGVGREVVGQRKDGSNFPMYLAVSEVSVSGRKMFTGIVRDLTDFKKMQNEIIQSQQLAAIGEMAASVGHEIKNPLAGISGAIEILRDTLPEGDSRRQVMDDILIEVKRLDNTVRDLLAFSRPWNPDAQPCDLVELVERVIQIFREKEEDVSINFVFARNTLRHAAMVDPWLFEKVMWNLIDNANDAMSDHGEISFEFYETPGFVTLVMEDSGEGVAAEDLGNVFRPFFTTKSRGTGLGLAICKKIMDAHGGSISLFSIPGKGTKVSVQLPVSDVLNDPSKRR